MQKKIIFLVLGAIAILAASVFYYQSADTAKIIYRTAKVERGNIIKSVSASGELNSVVTVQVGSEISGQISELFVDYNTHVKAGQVIARIDPESFQARVKQAEAELSVAMALVATRKASVLQAKANEDLKRDYERKLVLRKKGVVSVSDVDKAHANWKEAEARIKIAEAEVLHALAQVEQKMATLNIAKVNFKNTYIRSPVNGVVIGRDVDVGQTVAASLQAPVLFTIAKNLSKMQVETNIDEADIGQIREGQATKFTVDAYPVMKFNGIVTQIRKKPLTVQNVVTYTVVIAADNTEQKLLPGMTANVQVEVSNRRNVIRLPNKALRFAPPGINSRVVSKGVGSGMGTAQSNARPDRAARREQAQARMKQMIKALSLNPDQQARVREFGQHMRQRIRTLAQGGRGPGFRDAIKKLRKENSTKIMTILTPTQKTKFQAIIASRLSNPEAPGKVWILKDGKPSPVNVIIGVGDGNVTELVRGNLKEGQLVLTGIKRGNDG